MVVVRQHQSQHILKKINLVNVSEHTEHGLLQTHYGRGTACDDDDDDETSYTLTADIWYSYYTYMHLCIYVFTMFSFFVPSCLLLPSC